MHLCTFLMARFSCTTPSTMTLTARGENGRSQCIRMPTRCTQNEANLHVLQEGEGEGAPSQHVRGTLSYQVTCLKVVSYSDQLLLDVKHITFFPMLLNSTNGQVMGRWGLNTTSSEHQQCNNAIRTYIFPIYIYTLHTKVSQLPTYVCTVLYIFSMQHSHSQISFFKQFNQLFNQAVQHLPPLLVHSPNANLSLLQLVRPQGVVQSCSSSQSCIRELHTTHKRQTG